MDLSGGRGRGSGRGRGRGYQGKNPNPNFVPAYQQDPQQQQQQQQYHGGGGRSSFTRGGGGGRGGRRISGRGGIETGSILNCTYDISAECGRGQSCPRAQTHGLVKVQMRLQHAHTATINTLAMMDIGGNPHIVSGSDDQKICVRQLGNLDQVIETYAVDGPVYCIQIGPIVETTPLVMWSTETLLPETTAEPVGMVHLKVDNQPTPIQVKRPNLDPSKGQLGYTHTMKVRTFTYELRDGVLLIITAGQEGTMKLWSYSGGTDTELVMTYEGHTRAINRILLRNDNIWSCSNDWTIKVWDIRQQDCICTMNAVTDPNKHGHTGIVVCLELVSSDMEMVLSGGGDNKIIAWDANDGSYYGEVTHSCVVTALKCIDQCDGINKKKLLLVGLVDGKIAIRSACAGDNLILLLLLDSAVCRTNTVWSFLPIDFKYHNQHSETFFASAGADAQLIVWKLADLTPFMAIAN